MKAIPTGASKADINARRRIIEAELSRLKGRSFRCPCLGGVPVGIIGDSIGEIAAHASKSLRSTTAALRLPDMISNAYFFKMHLPKNNKQRKKFKFIFIYELHSHLETGYAKLMVGVRSEGRFLQYCITAQ